MSQKIDGDTETTHGNTRYEYRVPVKPSIELWYVYADSPEEAEAKIKNGFALFENTEVVGDELNWENAELVRSTFVGN